MDNFITIVGAVEVAQNYASAEKVQVESHGGRQYFVESSFTLLPTTCVGGANIVGRSE